MSTGEGSRVPGDELDTDTLASTLAHEFGHTALARNALDLPFIMPPQQYVETVGGETTIVVPLANPPEELRTSQIFENAYRSWSGLPLRRSYFHENDVLQYKLPSGQ